MSYEYETIIINKNVRVRIVADDQAEAPDWDTVGQIAYNSSHYTIGTENVSDERMQEISDGIKDGSLIGLAVYAYIHSGVTIRTGGGYGCPWDSGQSGWVYCTKADAIKNFGKKILTKKVLESTLKCLKCEVETFDQYLTGDVWGCIVETRTGEDEWDESDSCWGFFGIDYAREEAKSMGEAVAAQLDEDAHKAWRAALSEARERKYWAQRDVRTTPL